MKIVKTPSVEKNKGPILEVLKQYIRADGRLLEIGSGTGEHAVYCAAHFKGVHWVTSDLEDRLKEITLRLKKAQLPNVHGPEILKIGADDFSDTRPFDYVFSANTLHIMSWKENKTLFKLLAKRLRAGAKVFFYGPFNYEGKFTSPGNEALDQMLKEKDPKAGVRSFENVSQAMEKSGFKLIKDQEMPANNRFLVFERIPF